MIQPNPKTIPVKISPKGRKIFVTPEVALKKTADCPEELIPRIGIVDLQPAGDGTYRPIVRLHEHWVRVADAARALGVPNWALRRLITAGFLEAMQPTPLCYMLNMHSWYEHVEAVRRDPEFWNEQRRERYSAAL